MGMSTKAILAYGYDLGGDSSEWKVEGAGEYGELPDLDWYDPDDEDGDGFETVAITRLLASVADFTEEWEPDAEGYFDRQREAEARVGVEVRTHCSGDYPGFILATKVITVYRGDVEQIDPAWMATAPGEGDWDAKLAAAIEALGITPLQEQPRWLLCSYWG
jgi:hypothetical protein